MNTLLQGSTAVVELNNKTAVKTYLASTPQVERRIEVENLEWAYELGLPVVQLLTIGYNSQGDVEYIITTKAQGYTLGQLMSMGHADLAHQAVSMVQQYQHVAASAGLYLPDLLETDGNVRVTLEGKVTLVDVGDSI